MHTAMDIGVVGTIKGIHRFENGARFLSSGSGIEIYQGYPGIYLAA
jgi:hypothetical protein